MKKLLSILIFLSLFLSTQAFALTGAIGATSLTGGTSGALDFYDGSTLNDGDVAVVQTDGRTYFYRLDASSTLSESSPAVIAPDSNGGTTSGSYKRWMLQDIATGIITLPTTDGTPSVLAGRVFKTADATTITDFDDGYAGKIITVLAKHSLTFDTTTAQDASHNLDGSSADITADTGDILVWLCENGTTWNLVSNNDASVDNN